MLRTERFLFSSSIRNRQHMFSFNMSFSDICQWVIASLISSLLPAPSPFFTDSCWESFIPESLLGLLCSRADRDETISSISCFAVSCLLLNPLNISLSEGSSSPKASRLSKMDCRLYDADCVPQFNSKSSASPMAFKVFTTELKSATTGLVKDFPASLSSSSSPSSSKADRTYCRLYLIDSRRAIFPFWASTKFLADDVACKLISGDQYLLLCCLSVSERCWGEVGWITSSSSTTDKKQKTKKEIQNRKNDWTGNIEPSQLSFLFEVENEVKWKRKWKWRSDVGVSSLYTVIYLTEIRYIGTRRIILGIFETVSVARYHICCSMFDTYHLSPINKNVTIYEGQLWVLYFAIRNIMTRIIFPSTRILRSFLIFYDAIMSNCSISHLLYPKPYQT